MRDLLLDASALRERETAEVAPRYVEVSAVGLGQRLPIRYRYRLIAKSEWLSKTYHGKSLGEHVGLEE